MPPAIPAYTLGELPKNFTVVHLSGDSGRITEFALNKIKPSQNNCRFMHLAGVFAGAFQGVYFT